MEPNPTTPALRNPTNDEIEKLLGDLAESGESLAGFARTRGLSTWKLYRARRTRKARAAKPVKFDPVRIIATPVAPPPVELDHSSGHRLRVPVGFDTTTLLRLIEVLEAC